MVEVALWSFRILLGSAPSNILTVQLRRENQIATTECISRRRRLKGNAQKAITSGESGNTVVHNKIILECPAFLLLRVVPKAQAVVAFILRNKSCDAQVTGQESMMRGHGTGWMGMVVVSREPRMSLV